MGLGYAAVFPDNIIQGHLLHSSSILKTKLYAFFMTILHIGSLTALSFIVVSDSNSVLQAVQKFDFPHPVILYL